MPSFQGPVAGAGGSAAPAPPPGPPPPVVPPPPAVQAPPSGGSGSETKANALFSEINKAGTNIASGMANM